MNSNILITFEGIKAQLNNLGQRMNMIENDRREGNRQILESLGIMTVTRMMI